jgi:flagellar motor switch protein FliG
MKTAPKELKAALVLSTLEPGLAESILKQLGQLNGNRVRAQINRLKNSAVEPGLLEQVMGEFERMLAEPAAPAPPSLRLVHGAESVAEKRPAAPDSVASGIAAKRDSSTTPPQPATSAPAEPWQVESGDDPLRVLRLVPVEHLASALKRENSRTVSLVLDQLPIERAGEVLKRLPPETRRDASVQLARNLVVNQDLAKRVAEVVLQKCRAATGIPSEPLGDARAKKVADILRLLEKTDRSEILGVMDQSDPDNAARVREFLYQFEDILRIADRSMQKLLADVDSKNLALALKDAPSPISDKVLANLSKRARETLTEEIGFLTSVPASEIQAGRRVVVEVIQRLDQAGELVMDS